VADAYVVDTGVFLRWFMDLPLLTTDVRLQRAAEGSAPIEILAGIKKLGH
jgi:hypothetical protein